MRQATLTKSRSRTGSVAQVTAGTQISTGALAAFGTISTLVGMWAVACFVGAMITTGGPLALAGAWISAVIGS